MRTDDEIVARLKEVSEGEHDWLGTEQGDLIARLPWDKAKPLLSVDVTEEQWAGIHISRDRYHLINEMREYMPFAWEKANGFRGISAGRSMSHFRAWVWLAGDDLGEFNHYGFENLDDGVRKNREDE